jgi:hypothetical protein
MELRSKFQYRRVMVTGTDIEGDAIYVDPKTLDVTVVIGEHAADRFHAIYRADQIELWYVEKAKVLVDELMKLPADRQKSIFLDMVLNHCKTVDNESDEGDAVVHRLARLVTE